MEPRIAFQEEGRSTPKRKKEKISLISSQGVVQENERDVNRSIMSDRGSPQGIERERARSMDEDRVQVPSHVRSIAWSPLGKPLIVNKYFLLTYSLRKKKKLRFIHPPHSTLLRVIW